VVDFGDLKNNNFALKVNINLQNMSIKHYLARFDQKKCIFIVFLCAACLPASSIMHVPIPEQHCAMTLQHEFELSTLPSIPSNGQVGDLC
jgi:hypothetical protein